MTVAERARRWLEDETSKWLRWNSMDDLVFPGFHSYSAPAPAPARYPVLYGGILYYEGMQFLTASKAKADMLFGKDPPLDLPANDQRYKLQTLHALAQKGIRNDQHTRPKAAKHRRR